MANGSSSGACVRPARRPWRERRDRQIVAGNRRRLLRNAVRRHKTMKALRPVGRLGGPCRGRGHSRCAWRCRRRWPGCRPGSRPRCRKGRGHAAGRAAGRSRPGRQSPWPTTPDPRNRPRQTLRRRGRQDREAGGQLHPRLRNHPGTLFVDGNMGLDANDDFMYFRVQGPETEQLSPGRRSCRVSARGSVKPPAVCAA